MTILVAKIVVRFLQHCVIRRIMSYGKSHSCVANKVRNNASFPSIKDHCKFYNIDDQWSPIWLNNHQNLNWKDNRTRARNSNTRLWLIFHLLRDNKKSHFITYPNWRLVWWVIDRMAEPAQVRQINAGCRQPIHQSLPSSFHPLYNRDKFTLCSLPGRGGSKPNKSSQ